MDDFAKTLQLLADDTRFEIVKILGAGSVTVTDLVDRLGLGQSLVSYHLSVMKDAGVVSITTRGKWRIYSLNVSIDRNTKTLVELITGSKIVDARDADNPAGEEVRVSASRDGKRASPTKRPTRSSPSDEAGAARVKPKVEDFEDYLL